MSKQSVPNQSQPLPGPTGWNFDNSYTRLLSFFYKKQLPTPVLEPKTVLFNRTLAESLGLGTMSEAQAANFFSGNELPEGAEPVAQAYAGHQFGHFTMLGDGRAILLGEQITPDGKRVDVQLKGAGQTPFSRRGDGRAALGPMLREYVISEAMHALGIPTTRSLAVIATGEPVFREVTLPGAVLARVAQSHIRVGTFEYVSAWGNNAELKLLADYTLQRHYPDLKAADNPYLELLKAIIDRQASLIALWQRVGFIHGVMNTDNMAVSGETIDYGPCAFMDAYSPDTVFSSIDRQGRYAYARQPVMVQWNLARLAEALLPLLNPDEKQALDLGREAVLSFSATFERYWLAGMRAKLGLYTQEDGDALLVESLFNWMHKHQQDFTNTFRVLASDTFPQMDCFQAPDVADWHHQWQARLSRQPETPDAVRALMDAHNPCVIPRNHQVEKALQAAVEEGDFSVLRKLLHVLEQPYQALDDDEYRLPPAPGGLPYRTFCGT